ncbi:unnamed protein product [Brassica rapa]|uniref:Uncharacterized protein n=1 Tax=Brassica campestris TaxID=3711 RepID=A0A3P6A8N3_BRACM|nr:unnamed protein product [Brassica rapa]VDC83814.1 unnamed protein product [Brassica rapa]
MENHLTAVESKQIMVLASRFAANTRRGIAAQRPRFKKPEDPDFSAEPDD